MDEHVTAALFIEYYLRERGMTVADLNVAPTVVMFWTHPGARSTAERCNGAVSEHWLHAKHAPLYTGRVGGQRVSFTQAHVGAPAAAIQMEQLIAAGARRILGVGLCGSLTESAPVGTLVAPGLCIREEGTSLHYLPPEAGVGPTPGICAAILAAGNKLGHTILNGPHWTTDVLFRELKNKVENYRARGVLAVDMEASALYAVAQFRRVEAGMLLVVSDELWHQWRPAFFSPELRAAQETAISVALAAIEALGPVREGV